MNGVAMPGGTSFPRQVESEVLDDLDAADPQAVRSRRDLIRINRIMGAVHILNAALSREAAAPKRIIELGAGDGTLMLNLARRLAPRWPGVQVVLLDRQDLVGDSTTEGFARLGWELRTLQTDVEDWISDARSEHFDIGLANLFIHHFKASQVQRLFAAISKRTRTFLACEPRRTRPALLASHLVGLMGANAVTRNDAVLSVKAGFREQELSSLWPPGEQEWQLDEQRAGLFSHLFVARRIR
jgi:2-polyprenyl-3-methyl-5-hydroxy-6-metoxy-1,4-benzoquinol methylase